ncbi:MAG: TIGR02147 family protein [Bacteriovorax sp.]|nr:TIGR02147 family protein [Bacteriovorax sp.]
MKKYIISERPIIIEFSDYRDFLKKVFEWEKYKRPGFSYEYCARKLETSKSYLKQVFDKRIHVDLNRIPQIAKLFNISDFEHQYLIVMLLENQVKVQELKKHFKQVLTRLKMNDEIQDLKKYRDQIQQEGVQLPDWLALTIGALTEFPDFSSDPKWISEKISGEISPRDISAKWNSMIDHKMISLEKDKYYESSTHHSPDPFEVKSYKRYLHGALKTIEVLNGEIEDHRPALFFNGAIAISKEDFSKISESYYRFINEIIEIGKSSNNKDSVIFISNNLFSVVR